MPTIFDAIGGIGLGDLAEAGLGIAAVTDAMGRLSDIGSDVSAGAFDLAREGQEATAFQPLLLAQALVT